MIKGVLFDMDGVLIDTEEIITESSIEMFREKGYEVKPEDFKEFTGMGEDRFIGGTAEKNNIPLNLEKDKARAYEIYGRKISANLHPLEGVMEFIERCRKKKLKLAVATSADEIKMKMNLKEIGFTDHFFDAKVHGQDVIHKKPYPDIYLKAAHQLNLEPSECLVVEDAVSGVKAAHRAGCKCLAVTTSFSAKDLNEADWITDNLADAPEESISW